MSSARVEAVLRSWSQRYPDRARLEELGRSLQGKPIWGLQISDGAKVAAERPSILLVGAVHGDEILTVNIVLDAIAELLEPASTTATGAAVALPSHVTIWCIPVLNPDGLDTFLNVALRAGRKNGRDCDGDGVRGALEGVDLNRNFPFQWQAQCTPDKGSGCERTQCTSRYFRGESPGSEPETAALMALAEREHFVASVTYHMGTVALLAPYTIDGVVSPEPNEARDLAEAIAQNLGQHPSGQPLTVRRQLYPVQGTDQDWLRHTYGTLALLAEVGTWPPPTTEVERQALVVFARRIWQLLASRWVEGPSLWAHVRDSEGHPVVATLAVEQQVLRAGEQWTTRARDGGVGRFLPGPGRYTLTFRSPGYISEKRTIERELGVEMLDIVLRRAPSP